MHFGRPCSSLSLSRESLPQKRWGEVLPRFAKSESGLVPVDFVTTIDLLWLAEKERHVA